MTSQLPNPNSYNDVKLWARALHDYLTAQTRIGQQNNPLPVMLPHVSDNIVARAAVDGLVLFDPTAVTAIISLSGAWSPLSHIRSATAAEILDLTSSVNVVYKEAGAIVYDNTNQTLVVANGPNAADTWSRLTVATTVTPI